MQSFKEFMAEGKIGKNDVFVASVGAQDLKTGKNKYFNIYDDWADMKSHIEIWTKEGYDQFGGKGQGKPIVIMGSGHSPQYKEGHKGPLNMQGRKGGVIEFTGDWAKTTDKVAIDKIISKYKKSLTGYVYK